MKTHCIPNESDKTMGQLHVRKGVQVPSLRKWGHVYIRKKPTRVGSMLECVGRQYVFRGVLSVD